MCSGGEEGHLLASCASSCGQPATWPSSVPSSMSSCHTGLPWAGVQLDSVAMMRHGHSSGSRKSHPCLMPSCGLAFSSHCVFMAPSPVRCAPARDTWARTLLTFLAPMQESHVNLVARRGFFFVRKCFFAIQALQFGCAQEKKSCNCSRTYSHASL